MERLLTMGSYLVHELGEILHTNVLGHFKASYFIPALVPVHTSDSHGDTVVIIFT